jgi:ketosteroid isomerase-like protein
VLRRADPVHQVEAMHAAYVTGGLEGFLAWIDDDVELRPHTGGGRALRGPEELRAFHAERGRLGERLEPTVYEIEDHGDCVVVTGALRVTRHGRLTESQLAWVYVFEDGRLRSASSYATRADALRAVAVPA